MKIEQKKRGKGEREGKRNKGKGKRNEENEGRENLQNKWWLLSLHYP